MADQYLVEALKRKCEVSIQKSITVENVALMLTTADQRAAPALRKRCFEFVMVHFGEVLGTQTFTDLPPALLREVCTKASARGVRVGYR